LNNVLFCSAIFCTTGHKGDVVAPNYVRQAVHFLMKAVSRVDDLSEKAKLALLKHIQQGKLLPAD